MQTASFEPSVDRPEEATVLPPAHPWLEEWAKGLEFNKKIAKAMLAAGGGGVLGALQSLQALAFLDRPAKTIENYAYDVKPKPAEGFGRLNQVLAPENVELGLMAPIPPAGKIVTAATAGLKAAPVVGKFAAPLMAGIAKGAEPIINALTKVPEGVDAMAALKSLAHSHAQTAGFSEAHPALAALGPEDKQAVVKLQQEYNNKYNIWQNPKEQAKFLQEGGHDPTHLSWEEYPPGWADEMLKEFESLKGATSPPSAPVPALGPAASKSPVAPLAHWKHTADGKLKTKAPIPSGTVTQNGWTHPPGAVNAWNDTPGLYATHDSGATLEKLGSMDWALKFPDGAVEKFQHASEAKHFFYDAHDAGMVAPPSPALGPAAKASPLGTAGPPPLPSHWVEKMDPMSGDSHLVHKGTDVAIMHDEQSDTFNVIDPNGYTLHSNFNTPEEAAHAYDTMPTPTAGGTSFGGTPAADVWTDVPGQLGKHATHPSGLTIEQHPDTKNFHIKGSDGIMIDWEPSMDAAKQTANLHHIQNVPPAVAGQPSPFTPTLATSHLSGTHVPGAAPESIDNWNQIGPQMGSNAGGKYTAPDGQTYYVKYPADEDMTRNEMLGLMLYKAMGIHTPDVRLIEKGGRLGIASKWVEGIQTSGHNDELAAAIGAKEGFAADAWLANWDVVGMQRDNMLLDNGKALRADAGGSVLYRGLQGPKGARFGKLVDELDTLRNGRNRFTSPVFKDMTDADVKESAKKVADMHPDQIRMLVELHGPGDDVAKSALADTLIARRADILKRTGLDDPHAASLSAVQELEQVYHITPDELQMVMKYEPNLTPEEFLKRYHESEEQYVTHLGLTREQYRDPAIREKAAGVLQNPMGGPQELARGSDRINAFPEAPMTMADTNYRKYSNSQNWPSPWNFASAWKPATREGSTYFQGTQYPLENLRALTSEDKVWRPSEVQANPNSLQVKAFEQAYDFMKAEEAKGRVFPKEYYPDPKAGTGKIFPDGIEGRHVTKRWKDSGDGAGYTHVEQPSVALVLDQLGYKSITTYERGGPNYGFHHTVPLRWHKAPMDPRKHGMQGYFYGGGAAAGSGLAAYLAAQALQGQKPEPEQ